MPRERDERAGTEAEPAVRVALPAMAPATTAQRVLALQRTAGNRAVGAWLARNETATAPAQETSAPTRDTRLNYRDAGVADEEGLGDERLPFTDPNDGFAGWDAQAILNRLTQHDEDNFTFSDEVRCGANAALAIAIMAGPRQTATFANRVSARASGRTSMPTVRGSSISEAQQERINRALDNVSAALVASFAATNIEMAWARYSDLDNIAHAAKVAMTRNPRDFSYGTEVVDMVRGAGATERVNRQIRTRAAFDRELSDLRAGDAYIVHVDTSVLAHGTTPTATQGNHFVTVGRLPGAGDARYYLYDPFPRTGNQFVLSSSPDFWTLFQTAEGDWKWVAIESVTRAPRATRARR